MRTKIFVAGDKNLLYAGNIYKRFLSLTTIFNINSARNYFSSLTTEDKISVASDKNRAVCARLNESKYVQEQNILCYAYSCDIRLFQRPKPNCAV